MNEYLSCRSSSFKILCLTWLPLSQPPNPSQPLILHPKQLKIKPTTHFLLFSTLKLLNSFTMWCLLVISPPSHTKTSYPAAAPKENLPFCIIPHHPLSQLNTQHIAHTQLHTIHSSMKTTSVAAVLLSVVLPSTSAFLFLLPHHSVPSPPASRLGAASSSSSSPQHPEVTPELIKHTATLAQLQFDEAEIASLVPRFQAFLNFVDKMQDVPDTAAGLAPGTMPTVDKVLRPDQPSVFPNQDAIFANMAEQEDAYLSVPKVGEEDT